MSGGAVLIACLIQSNLGYWGVGMDHGDAYRDYAKFDPKGRETAHNWKRLFMNDKGDAVNFVDAYKILDSKGYITDKEVESLQKIRDFCGWQLEQSGFNDEQIHEYCVDTLVTSNMESVKEMMKNHGDLDKAQKFAMVHNLRTQNKSMPKKTVLSKSKDVTRLKYDSVKSSGD